jgi:hypothetical protein
VHRGGFTLPGVHPAVLLWGAPEASEWRTHRPAGAYDILGRMADTGTKPPRTFITAQNMEEAKAAAYANDPQTELVILGLSEYAAVTTCGWARRFFDSGGFSGF